MGLLIQSFKFFTLQYLIPYQQRQKAALLSLIILLGALSTQAQTPELQWARSWGGQGEDMSKFMVTDDTGNVYIAGWFYGTADFDPGNGIHNLSSAGINDIFVSKLDSAGNFIWAKRFGGSSSDIGRGIALDGQNNIYISGGFTGTVNFGTTALTAAGSAQGVFICKLDNAGNVQWARNIGTNSTNSATAYAITADSLGNTYTTGFFYFPNFNFNPAVNPPFSLSSIMNDIFIVKLDPAGGFGWAIKMGGNNNDNSRSVTVDNQGNLYSNGYFQQTAAFGTQNILSAGGQDIYAAKLDASGTFDWVAAMGGTSDEYAYGLAVDKQGNVYSTGYFNGTTDFNPGTGTYNLTSAGGRDAFVSKLDNQGNFVWAKRIGGSGEDMGYDITTDEQGNVYTTGYFNGTITLDALQLTSKGQQDIFICKQNAAGNFLWAISFGSAGDDIGRSISVDKEGYIYATGYFHGTVDFDPGPGTVNLTANGDFDVYVLKLAPCPHFTVTATAKDTILCAGETLELIAGGADSFIWSGPNGFNAQQQYPTLPATTPAASGTYTVTGYKGPECQQKASVNITVNPVYDITLTESICQGDSYSFDGQNLSTPGTYKATFQTTAGCDSAITLQLFVNPVYNDTITATICEGETYFFNGQNRTVTGFYTDARTSSLGCDSITVLDLSVTPLPAVIKLGNDTVLCHDETILLRPTPQLTQFDYLWSTGATTPTLSVNTDGKYWVRVTDPNGCMQSDTQNVKYIHLEQYLGEDTSLCKEDPIDLILKGNVPDGAQALWSTGATTPDIHITGGGNYWLTVTYPPCQGTDTIRIKAVTCDCRPQMPNAFSPNGDGLNDIFRPAAVGDCPLATYRLQIFNRYGQLVYKSSTQNEGWDGFINGKAADVGIYMYLLTYTTLLSDEEQTTRGDIMLLR